MQRIPVLLTATLLLLAVSAPAGARTLSHSDPGRPLPPTGPQIVPTSINPGDTGRWVAVLQIRLTDAGFRPGSITGTYEEETLGAVYAFQKVHGLPRDGAFRSEYWELLSATVGLPPVADAPDRVEVDLEKQVLFLIRQQRTQAVVPISSGNGDAYRNAGGRVVSARTPEGSYRFYKHVDGWRISYLGGLYRPFYFRGGYAIHGSNSVPPYPASHGCVRVELWDMDYLTTQLALGMPVYVYGRNLNRAAVLVPEDADGSRPIILRRIPTSA